MTPEGCLMLRHLSLSFLISYMLEGFMGKFSVVMPVAVKWPIKQLQ